MERIAFIFPGQGSQKVGMGKDLIEKYAEAKILWEKASKVLEEDGVNLSQLCFQGPEEELENTTNAQPAILTVSVILFKLMEKYNIRPLVMAGHSLGEYSALVASSSLKFEEAVRLVRKRGEYMLQATPLGSGSMSAILGLEEEKIIKLCQEVAAWGVVEVANYNSPAQIVVSGETKPLEKLTELAKEKGARKVIPLKVSAPFHSSLMESAKENLAHYLERVHFADPQIPVICNLNADYVKNREEVKLALIEQMTHPVRWVDTIKKMNAEGIDYFIEIGPGKVLGGLVKQILPQAKIFHVFDAISLEEAVEKIKGVL